MTREEVWIRAVSAVAQHKVAAVAIGFADSILEAFDKRFPQSFTCVCGETIYEGDHEEGQTIRCPNCKKEWASTNAG